MVIYMLYRDFVNKRFKCVEVPIKKETAKMLVFKEEVPEFGYKIQVRKDLMDIVINEHKLLIFTYNVEDGKKVLVNHCNSVIERHKRIIHGFNKFIKEIQ